MAIHSILIHEKLKLIFNLYFCALILCKSLTSRKVGVGLVQALYCPSTVWLVNGSGVWIYKLMPNNMVVACVFYFRLRRTINPRLTASISESVNCPSFPITISLSKVVILLNRIKDVYFQSIFIGWLKSNVKFFLPVQLSCNKGNSDVLIRIN